MAEKIAFVGLGIMGKPMAKNLMKAGYELYVYDLFPDPVAELEKEGLKVVNLLLKLHQIQILQ